MTTTTATTTNTISGPAVAVVAGGRPGDAVTVRHLRAGGSQRAIGRALAAAAHAVHGDAARPRPSDPEIERVRRRWFALHHPALAERSLGVADHHGIDVADTSIALDWLGTYPLPAGCSVGFHPAARTARGHGLLARNFDFPTASFSELTGGPPQPGERPLGADPWIVELHPDDGYASVAVTIMDVMGAMDGVNEAGLAVALLADNETPDPEPSGAPQVGVAEQQVVRYLLDTCATVHEAKAALRMAKQYYFFTPCHYVVADRTGASFVWELSPRRNREVVVAATGDDPLVCTNHLLHRWPDPSMLPDDDGPIGTAALTYSRWRHLAAAAADPAPAGDDDLWRRFEAVRFTAPLREARTFWHARYDVDDATAELSFFTHDEGDVSRYAEPLVLGAGR